LGHEHAAIVVFEADMDAMVIVGAGHHIGEAGVFELLRKKGWKMTQQ
jgi:uncharacterized protein YbaP (TraB family)